MSSGMLPCCACSKEFKHNEKAIKISVAMEKKLVGRKFTEEGYELMCLSCMADIIATHIRLISTIAAPSHSQTIQKPAHVELELKTELASLVDQAFAESNAPSKPAKGSKGSPVASKDPE